MPNYVTNVVNLTGDEQKINELREAVLNDDHRRLCIDFNRIIPMPEDVWKGNLGIRELQQYGEKNWYDWSIANWGTKWNAMRFDDDDQYSDEKIVFVTANSAPHPILQKLSEMFPDITMHHQWADEDVGYNCGERTYKGGQVLDAYYPDYGTLAVEYACQVMGTTPADHGLKLNEDGTEYICAEEENMEEMQL